MVSGMGIQILYIQNVLSVFYKKKRIAENIKLYLYKQPLERVTKFKYLGLWFDSKLTWKIHIDYIGKKCSKILNLMRCVVGQEWGANKQSMITLYCALLRSVLDYGCIVYGSASISMLKKLDLIQARALRCITGAIKTTPISAMQVEIGESPLDIRRKK